MASIDELITTILDHSAPSFRRRHAIADLARADDPKAQQTMMQVLDDEDRYLRREVVGALKRIEQDWVVPPLIKALKDADDYVQRDAVEALGRVGDERVVGPLRELAAASSYSIRSSAQRALEEIDRRGVSTIKADESSEVISEASAETAPDLAADSNTRADVADDSQTIVFESPVSEETDEPTSSETTSDEIAPVAIAEPVASTEQETAPSETVQSPAESATDEFDRLDSQDVPPVAVAEAVESQQPPASEFTNFETLSPEPATPEKPDSSSSDGIEFSEVKSTSSDTPEAAIIAEPVVPVEIAETTELPPTTSAAECYLVALPDGFVWSRAVRMKRLLGDDLRELPATYQSLTQQQKQLQQLEQRYQKTFLDLGLKRADKDDDVARCEEELQAAREHVNRLENSAARAERERRLLKSQADSMWNQLVGKFQPEHSDKMQNSLEEIKATQSKLRKKIAEAKDEVQQLEQQHKELTQPMQQLQEQLVAQNQEREATFAEIRETNDRIDTLILHALLQLSPTERQERLGQYAAKAADPAFFEICIEPLMRALSEANRQAEQLRTITQQSDEATAAAQQSLEALGEVIGSGFYVGVTDRKTTVRLNGSLRVSEQHGMFEGYRGADGWASGTGSGDASYQMEEVVWTSPADLPDAVRQFTETWLHTGRCAARHQRLAAIVEADRRTVGEYIRYLRSELERDFQENRS